jgi:hypothetical protein
LKNVPAEAEVIKLPIWEPYQLFQKFSGKKKQTDFVSTGKTSFFQKAALFVRGNFFIPDARKFWVMNLDIALINSMVLIPASPLKAGSAVPGLNIWPPKPV